MSYKVTRLGETIFAEVRGADLSRALTDDQFAEINTALLENGVIVFPDQHLTDEQQVAFSAYFGPLEEDLMDPTQHVAFMSNLESDGRFRDPDSRLSKFLRSNQQWHSDSTFLAAPAKLSLLSARQLPAEGGETQWADMRAAWRALPEERRRELENLIVIHDFQNSVRRHEETGKQALYVGSQADHILGMPEEEGRALIAELLELSAQDRFVYTHRWKVGDIVVWDNRRVNHRGRRWDEGSQPRVLHRTSVKGTGPTVENGRIVDEYVRLRNAA
jgi:alpha-ketoglutarate-dependent 2,4-dichlorophenoxyacetate dioxygenase